MFGITTGLWSNFGEPPLVAMKLTLLGDNFLYLPEVWVNGLGNLTATSSNNHYVDAGPEMMPKLKVAGRQSVPLVRKTN